MKHLPKVSEINLTQSNSFEKVPESYWQFLEAQPCWRGETLAQIARHNAEEFIAMFDIEITGKGFYQFEAVSEEAQDWMAANVEGFDYRNHVAYCDDSRLAQDIANGAVDDGLTVSVNGKAYEMMGA